MTITPPLPRDTILALPARKLPEALYACQLAPEQVMLLSCADGMFFYYKGAGRWQPHRNWQDCAYLIERYAMTLARRHWQEDWRLGTPTAALEVARFADIPSTICRLALLLSLEEAP